MRVSGVREMKMGGVEGWCLDSGELLLLAFGETAAGWGEERTDFGRWILQLVF